ncbi:HAD family hydrolase [Rubrivivax sp. RP6-9]|uniref:HAD family hydrolase n=1 Tax=Rubrivivax sp. RP6-9 TaxID=3415750 RepID=UPI003CC6651C
MPTPALTIIGLDADDTLWHNESFFRQSQDRFSELLSEYADTQTITQTLDTVEHKNLAVYGYGVKGFTLSMLEAALAITDARLPAQRLQQILELGREMMRHPVDLLPGVKQALAALSQRLPLVLITKGDLFHQESKLAASGVGEYFRGVEIVSTKSATTYARAFQRFGADPGQAVMAGNSVRSDVLPALEAGSYAALVPYPLLWAHEAAEAPSGHPRFRELECLGQLAPWIDALQARR